MPGLVEASDDGMYVTKFRGAGQGETALVAEVDGVIASFLALVPLLIAAAYAGYTLWSAGMSSSIPLTLNTPGHPLEATTGLIPLTPALRSWGVGEGLVH